MMESVFLPLPDFSTVSFLKRKITAKMNFSCSVAPVQHSALGPPRIYTKASYRFSARAVSRWDSFESADDKSVPEEAAEVVLDPGMFEEVFSTERKQDKAKPGRQRSRQPPLRESTAKSVLIPDEWVAMQKHHLRTKKERKQEALALQFQRAREREAEDRALKEEAAREAQERLYNSVFFKHHQVNRSSFVSWREEGRVSYDQAEGSDNDADDKLEDSEGEGKVEEDKILAEFEIKEAIEMVSGRACPKDYRSGLEFSSIEEVAERLREVAEMESSRGSDAGQGSVDNVQDEKAQVVELTAEEKAMLKIKSVNFDTISSKSWSPLHTLAAAGQVYLAAELIKRGAQVDTLDKEGLTPIHRAIQCGRKVMVRLLLKAGANPQVRDKDGATLSHYAAQTGNPDIAKLLLRDYVDVNSADKDGWTPLHVAVQSGRTELIKCLINRGADMNQTNNDGNSPYDLSLSFGNCFRFYDTIKFMKRKEAEFRTKRKSPNTEVVHDQLV